jgi:lysozyme
MERSLELYSDGRLYEYEEEQAVKVTDTHNQVDTIIHALRFSTATTLTVAPPDKHPPDVATPRGDRSVNEAGKSLLKAFEGCRLKTYDDGVGRLTIGYGHTQNVASGMSITQSQAEQLLQDDFEEYGAYVEAAVKTSVNDDQFSALVCFCFNVGPGRDGFGGSTLLKKLNAGDYQGAANQFVSWNKVEINGKLEPWLGLTRRRMAERSLFLSTPWQPALAYEGTGTEIIGQAPTLSPRTLKLTDNLMKGDDVRRVQEALKNAGIVIKADGFFGKDTAQAIKQFQEKHGLTVDGMVGTEMRTALKL